jgi:hypothetical protein
MKKLILLGFLIVSSVSSLAASVVDDSRKIEREGLFIRDLRICHQLEWRNLSIGLEYESLSLESSRVKMFVHKFLESYSNEADFWEVMNVKFVHALTNEFPEIQKLTSTFSLKTDEQLPFPRKSIVSYSADHPALKESFGFTKLNYQICSETFNQLDLSVMFDFWDNPDTFDYPDYRWVDEAINEFFKQRPLSFSKWNDLKPQLEAFLLDRFKTLRDIQVEITLAK